MAIFADRTAAGRELADVARRVAGRGCRRLRHPARRRRGRRRGRPAARAAARRRGRPQARRARRTRSSRSARSPRACASCIPMRCAPGAVTPEQLAFVEDLERVELDRRLRAFPRSGAAIAGRTAIVVDDGVATGATAEAACLRAARRERRSASCSPSPSRPPSWRPDPAAVDEYVCPHRMRDFWAVGQFYDDFTQTTDEEVARLLSRDLPEVPEPVDGVSARAPRAACRVRRRRCRARACGSRLIENVRALALGRRRRAAAPRCAARPCRTAPGPASRGSG